MFTDMYTIIRKEWKEVFLQKGGMRGGLLSQVIILALLGVFLPLQNGPEWLTSPAAALAWLWLPVMLTMNMGIIGVLWFGGIRITAGDMQIGQIISPHLPFRQIFPG